MECTRCHGFMMKELVYDLLENDGQFYVSGRHWAYRCVACGKVSDWVIEQNRGRWLAKRYPQTSKQGTQSQGRHER